MAHNITAVEIAAEAKKNDWIIHDSILADDSFIAWINNDAWHLDCPDRDYHVFSAAWSACNMTKALQQINLI